MGSNLTCLAPSQIFPIEYYLNDIQNINYIENLGSTRFFKVAKSYSRDGYIVAKIFVMHGLTINISPYKEKIENIKSKLNNTANCLLYNKIEQSDKAAILFRQFIKYNLYERISTRPFLLPIEKCWIAFLILSAADQSHEMNICHGDIKSENILITSWMWVYLSDYAPFKPTFLPSDNPADFSYFFDASRRRTCYVAPERFVQNSWKFYENKDLNNVELNSVDITKGELLPSMDIFSIGCIFIELFTDGMSPFDLSQLLAYRSDEYSPDYLISAIQNTHIQELVTSMIQKDPTLRLSAEEYLKIQRGKAFPEYFYTFLKPYCQKFSITPILNSDERVKSMNRSIDIFINQFNNTENSQGYCIILSLLCSSVRCLQLCETKLMSLKLFKLISNNVLPSIILDRIVPFILNLTRDKFVYVRCQSIRTLTYCLLKVNRISIEDSNIFSEYILPGISDAAIDSSHLVRMVYAENIIIIMDHALKLLKLSHFGNQNSLQEFSLEFYSGKQTSYDSELQVLQDLITQKVVLLLSDNDNAVKRCLFKNDITILCNFFGKQKANDILLSHMITFLNDKNDWRLRASFFETVKNIAVFIGWQCSFILSPLIQQGLLDNEEFVIIETLSCIQVLAKNQLLHKPLIIELLRNISCFLIHPNLWIRIRTIEFVTTVSRTFEPADNYCYLLPLLEIFLSNKIVQLNNDIIIYNLLKKPISRLIFNQLLKLENFDNFIAFLHKKSKDRKINGNKQIIINSSLNDTISNNMKKLISQGMDVEEEEKILSFVDILRKMRNQQVKLNESKGNLYITNIDASPKYFTLKIKNDNMDPDLFFKSQQNTIKKRNVDSMSEDWREMFGSNFSSNNEYLHLNSKTEDINKSNESLGQPSLTSSTVLFASNESGLSDKSKYLEPRCKIELDKFFCKKLEQFKQDQYIINLMDNTVNDSKPIPAGWRPRGTLVAHLHEHRGTVNRLAVNKKNCLLASCSNDGTVKIWDCQRLDGKSITNRSKFTYAKQGGQIKVICFCNSGDSICSASDAGTIHVNSIESQNKTPNLSAEQNIDIEKYGFLVDMKCFDFISEAVITYATVYGDIIGWDLRKPGTAWHIRNDPKIGLITSFDVSRQLCWLIVGTSTGAHICWDMRFKLPINKIIHQSGARVRKLVIDNSSQSNFFSATQGNNELTLYDAETSAHLKTFWASPAPVLTYTQATKHSYNGIYLGHSNVGTGASFILTGGSDMRIRCWEVDRPSDSKIIIGAATDIPQKVSYNCRMIDASHVIYESYEEKLHATEGIPCSVSPGHHDIITDITVTHPSQSYMISSSRDGIIKIWK